MRIISGSHKGRKLLIPKKLPARPTTDFAKESLFNILRNRVYFDEIRVLDLFSGTGSISYEFASRGVPSIIAVDAHAAGVKYIEKTATDLEFPIQVFRMDVFKFLESHTQKFDLIFSDPPYDMPQEDFQKLITLIFEKKLLADDGILIIEHHKNLNFDQLPFLDERRKYGDSVFSFFSERAE